MFVRTKFFDYWLFQIGVIIVKYVNIWLWYKIEQSS